MAEPDLAAVSATPTEVGVALRRCVGDLASFAEKHWGQAPLLRHDADVTGLLRLDDVDELIADRGLRTPFVRLARAGKIVPPSRYTGSGGLGAEIGDQVRDDRLLAEFAAGATVVLQGLHRIWPPLRDFCTELVADVGCAVQANAYLTPPGGTGFVTHYDTHDVIVMQTAGRKHWRIHEPVYPDPLDRDGWSARSDEVAATATGAPVIDEVFHPGDVLYLPRGWLHAASAEDATSLHITLGLRRPTRYTIVETLLAAVADDPRLRAGLPLGIDLTDADQLAPHLAEVTEILRESLADPALADNVPNRLRRTEWATTRPGPIRPLAQIAAAERLSATDTVIRRPGLRCALDQDGDGIRLVVADRVITLPSGCAPALRQLLAGRPVRVRDLDGFDTDSDRIVVVQRLLREAIIIPA